MQSQGFLDPQISTFSLILLPALSFLMSLAGCCLGYFTLSLFIFS